MPRRRFARRGLHHAAAGEPQAHAALGDAVTQRSPLLAITSSVRNPFCISKRSHSIRMAQLARSEHPASLRGEEQEAGSVLIVMAPVNLIPRRDTTRSPLPV